jgi:hypothetical protein
VAHAGSNVAGGGINATSAAKATLCTARHGVGSHAEPPTPEYAMPTGKKFARQSRAA